MNDSLMEKCLAFCQGLVQSNNKFSFNFSCGKDNFNFDNKELANCSWKKKKKSPSQLRREKKRREASKVTQEDTEKVPVQVTSDNLHFKCTQCDSNFKSEKGLNIHIGKAHKKEELPTPEKERRSSELEELSLNLTPSRERREEPEDTLEEVLKQPKIFQLRKECDTKTCMKKVQGIEEMVEALAQANFYNNGCFCDSCDS